SLGPRLVIEEFLSGEEVSLIALCDGKNIVPLEPTQDHKTVGDGDTGPNTGSMGAYCDGRILSEADVGTVLDTVIRPVVETTRFTGFLYAGLMMTADGPKVLEFNVRLGDPETQALMHSLHGDFADILNMIVNGVGVVSAGAWGSCSVCVVIAAPGYPEQPRTGNVITGIEEAERAGAVVFHAGTKQQNGNLVTNGGRVLGVTAGGSTLPEAARNTYQAVKKIQFPGMHYRRDIGAKGLRRW